MRTPGIYVIRNLITGRCYVGSSVNPRKRWNEHKSALRNTRHENSHLQRAWLKYGEHAFSFEVAERVEIESELPKREQEHLDRLRPFIYNIGKSTESPWRGQQFSHEHKAALARAWAIRRERDDMRKTVRKQAEKKSLREERSKKCLNGHLKTDSNFFINSKGWRMCLECREERNLKRNAIYRAEHGPDGRKTRKTRTVAA